MSTVNIALIDKVSDLPGSVPHGSETLTVNASASVQSTITGLLSKVWEIYVDGDATYITAGANPDASEAPRRLLQGGPYHFAVTAEGEKIAARAVA